MVGIFGSYSSYDGYESSGVLQVDASFVLEPGPEVQGPLAGQAHIEYGQENGDLYSVNAVGMKTWLGAGYSGDSEHFNEPEFQDLKSQGPLPAGAYEMTAVTQQRGPNTIVLAADPANDMYGRDGFLIHGDNAAANHTASEGCIVTGPEVRAQIVALIKEGVTGLQVQP